MIAGLTDVVVDYGGARALGPFSLDVEDGEIIALVGPSGCGKSTAMRLLAGLEGATAGAVTRTANRGETSLVFQSPTLMPWATALANVALPLRLNGVAMDDALQRARGALDRVKLPGVENRKPAQLSGGMAMRAALARALVSNPRLLLMDEPFAALDEITRRVLADDVLALWAATRPAIVFVTHNVEEAVYMASRVVVMGPGPGRQIATIDVASPLPRPSDFRTTSDFRHAVETVSAALAQAMEQAA